MTASPRPLGQRRGACRTDGRILAIRRRDNGRCEPPGGILDLDETIDEGLSREVSEEAASLLVEIDHLTGSTRT